MAQAALSDSAGSVGVDTPGRSASRKHFRLVRRVILVLVGLCIVAVSVAAVAWWFYKPVSSVVDFGGTAPGRIVIGLRTENTGHFDLRVTGVEAQNPGKGVRLSSVRTRSTPSASSVPGFRPLTLKPGQHVYLVLEYALTCGQLASRGASLGGIDVRYEMLSFGRTKHVALSNVPGELTPAQACG